MSEFVMVTPRRPPSMNKGPNRLFQEALREEASRHRVGLPLLSGDLYVRIFWFHREPTTQDVDNIAKNILDALKGVVFDDDFRVTRCLTGKIDLNRDFELDESRVPADALSSLRRMLDDNSQSHVLYIEVGVAARRVVFGPIDEGERNVYD